MTRKNSITPARKQPTLSHRLETLLHTMRCITKHEDALCELAHEVKRSGSLSSEAVEELHQILNTLPSEDYLHDLDALAEILMQSSATEKRLRKKPSK